MADLAMQEEFSEVVAGRMSPADRVELFMADLQNLFWNNTDNGFAPDVDENREQALSAIGTYVDEHVGDLYLGPEHAQVFKDELTRLSVEREPYLISEQKFGARDLEGAFIKMAETLEPNETIRVSSVQGAIGITNHINFGEISPVLLLPVASMVDHVTTQELALQQKPDLDADGVMPLKVAQ